MNGYPDAMSEIRPALDDLWRKGHLRELEGDLDCFIRDHLTDIRKAMREGKGGGLDVARLRHSRGELSERQFVDFCVRATLRRRGSCNPARDIVEQRQEIGREVWYEGERRRAPVPDDRREQIAREWASRHAPLWREWRLYQLLYVWDKKADQYLPIISFRE